MPTSYAVTIDGRTFIRQGTRAVLAEGMRATAVKYNPYHDSAGRFATGHGATSVSLRPGGYTDQQKERIAQATGARQEAAKPLETADFVDIAAGLNSSTMHNFDEATSYRQSFERIYGEQGTKITKAVDDWQAGGDRGMSRVRDEADDYLNGGKADTGGALLMHTIAHAEPTSPELHRGVGVFDKTPDQVVAEFQKAGTIDMDLSSFTRDEGVADTFARANAGTTPVTFTLRRGARALHIEPLTQAEEYFGQKEWVTSGRFRVRWAMSSGDAVFVELEQEGTFG